MLWQGTIHGTAAWEESGEGENAHSHPVPSGRRRLGARNGRMAQQAEGALERAGALLRVDGLGHGTEAGGA